MSKHIRYRPTGPNTSPLISTDLYISLEMRRWILENETPGRFGYFKAGVETP